MQDEITRKGVVFNEMKGVYSSPDSVNQRAVQHSLFPDNTYGEDSGGDPKVIPELTFEEFKVCWLLACCCSHLHITYVHNQYIYITVQLQYTVSSFRLCLYTQAVLASPVG